MAALCEAKLSLLHLCAHEYVLPQRMALKATPFYLKMTLAGYFIAYPSHRFNEVTGCFQL